MKPITKKILKIVGTVLAVVAVMIGLFFLFKHLGITDKDSLKKIIKKAGPWGPIVFFLLQVTMATLLPVIPGVSFTFLIVGGTIFDNVFLAAFLALIGVWTSSVLLFTIGNTLGEKVAAKIVGKDELNKAQDLNDTKSKIFLPLMFLFPFFPDDALCLTAGMTKMKYRYFIPVVMIFRSVGALVTLLSSFYSKELFVVLGLNTLSPIGWVMLVNLIAIDVFALHKFTRVLEKKINDKKRAEALILATKEVETVSDVEVIEDSSKIKTEL